MPEGGAPPPLNSYVGVLPDPGWQIHPPSHTAAALVTAVQQRLETLGFLSDRTPLSELHRCLPAEVMALNEHYTNTVSRAFYTPDTAILDAYYELIAHIARHHFPWDFLFQAQPIVRFHFPVPFPVGMRSSGGTPRQIHSDILGGHPLQMVQGWLALTDCSGTAALQCSTRDDGTTLLSRYRDRLGPKAPPFADSLNHFYGCWDTDPGFGESVVAACRPISMRAGDLLFFDPRCLHGGTENIEDSTRVSLDFRILPVAHEEAVRGQAGTPTAKRFRRGDVFHTHSAHTCFARP